MQFVTPMRLLDIEIVKGISVTVCSSLVTSTCTPPLVVVVNFT